MNLFRLLGDLSHLASILILIHAITSKRSCRGISFKTQLIYLVVFLTRYVVHYTTHSCTVPCSTPSLILCQSLQLCRLAHGILHLPLQHYDEVVLHRFSCLRSLPHEGQVQVSSLFPCSSSARALGNVFGTRHLQQSPACVQRESQGIRMHCITLPLRRNPSRSPSSRRSSKPARRSSLR